MSQNPYYLFLNDQFFYVDKQYVKKIVFLIFWGEGVYFLKSDVKLSLQDDFPVLLFIYL